VGPPQTWTRACHARFPGAFRATVRELVAALHVRSIRSVGGACGGGSGGGGDVLAAGPGVDGEVDEGGSASPQLWGAGFAEVVAMEPAILDIVLGQLACLTYGCRAEGDPGHSGG